MARSKKKKWKSRIKKALKLAAIGGATYLAAKRFGGKRKGTGEGFLKSGAAGGASLADLAEPAAVTGTVYPGENKVVAPVINTGDTGNTITRTSGIKLSPTGQKIGAGGLQGGLSRGVLAQIAQAKANAPKGIIRPGSVPMQRTGIHPRGRLTEYKKGGRVTGIAKRGFGRALMKGKK